jgi:hypothetical protein
MKKRMRDGLLIAFALPAYQVWNIAKYCSVQKGWVAKVGMFITFLPVFILSTAIWIGFWAVILGLLRTHGSRISGF